MPLLTKFIMILLALLPVSCDLLSGLGKLAVSPDLENLGEGYFYALNMEDTEYSYDVVKAEMLFESESCVIWAETGSGVTENLAREIAGKYEKGIRPSLIENFSKKEFTYKGGEYTFSDMLDFANWLAGGSDGKLTILLMDIKDGYQKGVSDAYVAGYFYSGNFGKKGRNVAGSSYYYSNAKDMIYLDTTPGLLSANSGQVLVTCAHELQHLINFVTGVYMDKNTSMDTWINEGLSSQAEYFYLGKATPDDKLLWLKRAEKKSFANGNNFFVWGNHSDDKLAILDDYATVYLFFRWLYLQADPSFQPEIFHQIESSGMNDYRAITTIAARINPDWSSWEKLLEAWLAANYVPNSSLGYNGDSDLQRTISVQPISGKTIKLYPGEGVYSVMGNTSVPANSGNIRYAKLNGLTEDALLTFNANTYKSGDREEGSLSGVSPPVSRARSAAGGQTEQVSGPYVLDARDMLERNR